MLRLSRLLCSVCALAVLLSASAASAQIIINRRPVVVVNRRPVVVVDQRPRVVIDRRPVVVVNRRPVVVVRRHGHGRW